jgi:hypothetical protein
VGIHDVLHDIDAPTGVLREPEATEGVDDRDVARGVLVADVVYGDRLRERTRCGTGCRSIAGSSSRYKLPAMVRTVRRPSRVARPFSMRRSDSAVPSRQPQAVASSCSSGGDAASSGVSVGWVSKRVSARRESRV